MSAKERAPLGAEYADIIAVALVPSETSLRLDCPKG